MKTIRIIILIALVVSIMPLDAFCEDHHETAEHHHGVVLCHSSCHGAVLTSDTTADLPVISSTFTSTYELTYEGPILPTEVKPPKHLS